MMEVGYIGLLNILVAGVLHMYIIHYSQGEAIIYCIGNFPSTIYTRIMSHFHTPHQPPHLLERTIEQPSHITSTSTSPPIDDTISCDELIRVCSDAELQIYIS